METERWFAVYTRSRCEKKVYKLLKDNNLESYCPLNRVRRRWSDRIKVVELPLFTSYVFVKIREARMEEVRRIPGVLNFVYWNGRPAVIRDQEIENIQRFLGDYENVTVIRKELKPGNEVVVGTGPLMDKRGRVLEVKGKMVKIQIESLGYELVAYVDKAKLV
jgi:transcription antitermination factor NusG